jgi:hypothetical protein
MKHSSHKISDKTFGFLRDSYERSVQEFLDDPDGCTCNDPSLLMEHYANMVEVGENVGVSFWEMAAGEGTQYEIDRLQEMLLEAGYDGPPLPQVVSYRDQKWFGEEHEQSHT